MFQTTTFKSNSQQPPKEVVKANAKRRHMEDHLGEHWAGIMQALRDSLTITTSLLCHFSHNIHGLHPGVPRLPLPEADAQHLRAVHHPAGDGVPDRGSRRVSLVAPGKVSGIGQPTHVRLRVKSKYLTQVD